MYTSDSCTADIGKMVKMVKMYQASHLDTIHSLNRSRHKREYGFSQFKDTEASNISNNIPHTILFWTFLRDC